MTTDGTPGTKTEMAAEERPAGETASAPGSTIATTTAEVGPAGQLPTITADAMPAEQTSAPVTAEVAPPEQSADTTVADATQAEKPAAQVVPTSILTIDLGGTTVKILATGQTESREAPSGKGFTPAKLVETVRQLTDGWEYEVITLGYPGLVGASGPRSEPGNLGPGWVGFDFAAAFGKPVKMVNDAAMQALGSYEGGRMLFLGLGTGLGSALITGRVIIPLELGRLTYDGERTLADVLGRRGLEKRGKGKWRKSLKKVVTTLMHAFLADYVVIGGGNAGRVKELPPGARRGHNLTAFRGGFRLWGVEDVWILAPAGGESPQPTVQEELRML